MVTCTPTAQDNALTCK